MQQLRFIRGVTQQPLMAVIGVIAGAGVAKSGYGVWAVGGIAAAIPIYAGAAVTIMATRSLAAWAARMQRREATARCCCRA
ncbi:MAG: hypothetical protein AB1490_10090 [Pseudomonadota bacterium]